MRPLYLHSRFKCEGLYKHCSFWIKLALLFPFVILIFSFSFCHFPLDEKEETSISRPQRSWMNTSTPTSATRTPARRPRRSWQRNAPLQSHRWDTLTFTPYSDVEYIWMLRNLWSKDTNSSQITFKLKLIYVISDLFINSCLLRYPTGLETRGSDTRKILENSKKKPTCMLPKPLWPQPASPPMAAKPTRLPHQIQPVSIAVNQHTNNRCVGFSLVFSKF